MSEDLGRPLLQFAVDFYKQLLTESGAPGNIFFSPFSIVAAMSMTLAGARDDTALQIERALNIDGNAAPKQFSNFLCKLDSYEPSVVLRVANRLYTQKTLTPLESYTTLLKEFYNSTIAPVDFSSSADKVRLEINQWVEEVTLSKIRDLIPDGVVHSETLLVLINAIYFKGVWENEFNPDATSKQEFHETKSKTTTVDMMHKEARFRTCRCDELKVQALEIPYKGSKMSMVILLPDEIAGLSTLEERLTASKLSNLLSSMGKPTVVELQLPKFKIEQTVDLKKNLEAIGIHDLFSNNADLTGISDKRSLKVSDAIHKAFVEVNEEGTEAAAATALMAVNYCARFALAFTVDHPFLFLIRCHDPDAVLFVGSVRSM